MLVKYPTDPPIDAITNVVTSIKNKQFDKAVLAEQLWNIQGYAFSKVFGEPTGLAAAQDLTNEQAAEMLEAVKDNNGFAINWLSIAKWTVQLALSLL